MTSDLETHLRYFVVNTVFFFFWLVRLKIF